MRISRGLNKDDFQELIDPKHSYNLKNARSSVTIDTLGAVASELRVDALTLLTVTASLEQRESHDELLGRLGIEGKQLAELSVLARWHGEFQNGSLIAMQSGRGTSPDKVKAILKFRTQGLSRKETADDVGVSATTVGRIWNRVGK